MPTVEDSPFSNSAVSGIVLSGGTTGSAASLVVRRSKCRRRRVRGRGQHGSGLVRVEWPVDGGGFGVLGERADGVRFGITSSYAGGGGAVERFVVLGELPLGCVYRGCTGGEPDAGAGRRRVGPAGERGVRHGTFGLTPSEEWTQFKSRSRPPRRTGRAPIGALTSCRPARTLTMVGHLSYGAPEPGGAVCLWTRSGHASSGASGANWCGNDESWTIPLQRAPSLYLIRRRRCSAGCWGRRRSGAWRARRA